MKQPVFRFAPSPNGRLHLGHAYSALLNEDWAHRLRGRLLLRIEDIDLTRCRPDLAVAIEEDLAWLGLAWERPVRRQSEHFDDYRAASGRLKSRGLLYRCFCTRKEIAAAVAAREAETGRLWPRDPDGAPLYPGTCRELDEAIAAGRSEAGTPHGWRIDMARALALSPGPHAYTAVDRERRETITAAHPEKWGDAVVVRKEIPTSYHLSVVTDDALQGITHVVRGMDLLTATDLHVLLQGLLDLPRPLYHHHGLIRDPEGGKLSKSLRSESLADLRARGVSPAEIRARLGFGS